MPRAEDEAYAVAAAAPREPDGSVDREVYLAEYERCLAERHERLMRDARSAFRVMDAWPGVKSQEDWENTVQQASEDYDRGPFLIDRLGAERHLDPALMAVLLVLRRRLIDEYGATTAAELMMIDGVVLSYYHLLRVNGWIGDLAQWLEAEFFSKEPLSAKFKAYYGTDKVRGLKVEDIVSQLGERLMPLLDRSDRMMIRNLKAVEALHGRPAPSVSIGQMNVAAAQSNTAVVPPTPSTKESSRDGQNGGRHVVK